MTTLVQIASNLAQKEVVANENFAVVATAGLGGRKYSASTGLTWGYYGGIMRVNGVLTSISDGTLSLTASSTNYIEVNASGTVSFNTTAFTAGRIPLYTAVTDGTGVTSYTDYRLSNFQYCGRLSKSVAGSSDVTLTAAEAANNILEFTGALTGNINVIVPTVNQTWDVYNNTSGAFTLTVKTSGGSGVVVRQGKRERVYADATNVVGAVECVTQLSVASGGDFAVGHTNTTPGTTGNQTINKLAGRVNIAAAGTTVTVTNSLVAASSHVFCNLASNDTTAWIKNVVPGSGSFVVTLGAAATAEVAIDFFVVNGF